MSNQSETKSKKDTLTRCIFVYLAAFALIFFIAPSVADDTSSAKYLAGSPELSAHLSGTNEFTPGEEYSVPIAIENTGTIEYKIVKSSIIGAGDVPNTAKNLNVNLGAADAPIVIKSDSQLVGDLPASSSVAADFHLTINTDAPAGTYYLPVTLNYTYLYSATQLGTDTLSYVYKSVNDTVIVPIKIKPDVQITALSVSTKDLNAGNEGYVYVSLKNTGFEDGNNATVSVQPHENSPLTPTEGSFYISNYSARSVVNSTFKLMVSDDAQVKTYPLDLTVNYKNSDGVYVNSKTITIGVPVGGKIKFDVEPVRTDITPGSTTIITANYRNTGGATAYNAEARISAIDPFSSNDDTAFLGTMAPGDVRQASFKVSVRSDTTTKDFGLDSEIQYRDAQDNKITSDPLKLTVHVVPAGALMTYGIFVVLVVAGILIGLGYWVHSRQTKNR